MNKIIEVFVDRCQGCHTCELECALAHSKSDTFQQAVQSNEQLCSRISLVVKGEKVIPTLCRHCTKAFCMDACPVSVITRSGPDEPVILDTEKCIGAGGCMEKCPFGVIYTVPGTKLSIKCDLCIDRLEKGGIPACAASCPTNAIRFTSLDDIPEDRRKKVEGKFRVSVVQSKVLKN